ncbi:PHD finger protein 7-like [Anopheles ziemanni]|uniref:PHD finger protein 7-like n=1 Tax=Anopheles coustani TaxID=139045 RepID=UPI0026595F16|nr:PHD finger protein 7-like [Anopheles coustani]XP_058166770.1 PHD finger protein 7-like [Anopheles ziemanni]
METQNTFNFSYCTDPKFKLNVVKKKTDDPCDICLLREWKPARYGEFIVKECKSTENLRCHYFCLLSGTFIPQRGVNSAGITGFLIRDIINSFYEYRDKKCAYCCHPSASIKCCVDGCDRWFHYICGYKNSCLTQFCGQYKSFCDQHLPEEYSKPLQTKYNECEICYEILPRPTDADYNPIAIIRTCGGDDCEPGRMHRECVQHFAFSAGYDFKCPICFSKDYNNYVAPRGIFVPSRDASWEREPGAFKDLHKRKCTAVDCALASTKDARNVMKMVGCSVCGGQLMHKICTKLADPRKYLCQACMDETFIKLL